MNNFKIKLEAFLEEVNKSHKNKIESEIKSQEELKIELKQLYDNYDFKLIKSVIEGLENRIKFLDDKTDFDKFWEIFQGFLKQSNFTYSKDQKLTSLYFKTVEIESVRKVFDQFKILSSKFNRQN